MPSLRFRRLIGGIAFARLRDPHLTRSRRAFSATLSTPALDRRTSRWFTASPCRATAKGHQTVGLAPSSLVQHRFRRYRLLHRFLLQRSRHTVVGEAHQFSVPTLGPLPVKPVQIDV